MPSQLTEHSPKLLPDTFPNPSNVMHAAAASAELWIKNLPPVLTWRKRRYDRKFSNGAVAQFRGIFDSFEEALASAPTTKALGFDVAQFEGYFDDRRGKLFLYDYPILFWLNHIVKPNSRVFDMGGNTAVHYVAYRHYLHTWTQLYWEVCEVPVIVDAGEIFAEQEGFSERLSFTSNPGDASGADVLLSAGTIQYLDKPGLTELLDSLEVLPRHLLLNKLPLYDGEPYITLQNGGVIFIAQRVFNRSQLLSELAERGYHVVDEWRDDSISCHVPFHPECAVSSYTGLYLSREPGV